MDAYLPIMISRGDDVDNLLLANLKSQENNPIWSVSSVSSKFNLFRIFAWIFGEMSQMLKS